MSENRNKDYVNKFLSMSKEKNRLSHSYLFVGAKGSGKLEVAKYLCKLILCKNNACNECNICKRIQEENHVNIEFIRPIDNIVRKDQIVELQNKFSKMALEEGAKIYIIENAEKMNASASNSLLKFLEEPVGNIYGILLSDDIDRMLSTIISRSQVLHLTNNNYLAVKEFLLNEGADTNNATMIPLITSDMLNAKEILESNSHESMIKGSLDVIRRIGTPKLTLQATVFHKLNRVEQKTYFNLILKFMMDCMYVKIGKDIIHYKEKYEHVNRVVGIYSLESIIEIINILIDCDSKLNTNVNAGLFLDSVMVKIERVTYENN